MPGPIPGKVLVAEGARIPLPHGELVLPDTPVPKAVQGHVRAELQAGEPRPGYESDARIGPE
eukprot:569958-Prorocentrum_minimum.AAC.2